MIRKGVRHRERFDQLRTAPCELLGIPFGEFRLDGCLIGYLDPASGADRPANGYLMS